MLKNHSHLPPKFVSYYLMSPGLALHTLRWGSFRHWSTFTCAPTQKRGGDNKNEPQSQFWRPHPPGPQPEDQDVEGVPCPVSRHRPRVVVMPNDGRGHRDLVPVGVAVPVLDPDAGRLVRQGMRLRGNHAMAHGLF